jgi:hypothetical protein
MIALQSAPASRPLQALSLVSGLDREELCASNPIAVVAAPVRRFLAGVDCKPGKGTDELADRSNPARR